MEKLLKQKEDLEDAISSGDWIPRSGPSGKQKSPNVIRSAIRKYLAEKGITQTEFLSRIGVNSNSYNRFMTQKYKDEWSATDNGTYWAAAQHLARDDIDSKIKALEEKKSGSAASKRKADDISATVDETSAPAPESAAAKKAKKAETAQLLEAICAVDVPEDGPIYANCDEVRTWIVKFYRLTGITDAAFLRCIGAQSNSLNSFRTFKGKGAGASNLIYPRTWRLMEQYRIHQGKPKSAHHLEQEKRWGAEGFPQRHDDGKRYVFGGDAYVDPRIFDIEYGQDMRNEYEAKRASEGKPVTKLSAAAPAAAPAAPAAAPAAPAVAGTSSASAAPAAARPNDFPLASIQRTRDAKAAKDKAAAEKAAVEKAAKSAASSEDVLASVYGKLKAGLPTSEAELDQVEAALAAAKGGDCSSEEVMAVLGGFSVESRKEAQTQPKPAAARASRAKPEPTTASAATKAALVPKTPVSTTTSTTAVSPKGATVKKEKAMPKSPPATITSFFKKVDKQ